MNVENKQIHCHGRNYTGTAKHNTKSMKPSKLILFTFGYQGWGNHTEELVSNIDRSERKAGYAPPKFVDIRFRRVVRAKGFVSNRFGDLVGSNRYEHMKSLGNERIGSGEEGIKIHDPKAVSKLLDIGLDAARDNRRVIYFCSCGEPIGCHRRVVARLLRKAGEKRGIEVTNIEWPGGEPLFVDLEVSREIFLKVEQGCRYVPLPNGRPDLRTLPWYSVVRFHLKAGKNRPPIPILTGPACFVKGMWCLPGWEHGWEGINQHATAKRIRKWRIRDGYSAY